LAGLGYDFLIRPAATDESPLVGESPLAQTLRLAESKAREVAQTEPDSLVLAADSLVSLGDRIFGKPQDLAEARLFLRDLSGQAHQVTTGLCLLGPCAPEPRREAVISEVLFRPLTEREIEAYLEKGESLDKAGAYAIQGHGLGLIQEVRGSLTNVMGLPVREVILALEKFLGPRP
jgi:septum formation protein